MLTVLDGLRNVNLITVLFRMICAVLCGGAIGLERSYKNRPAGVRTHILICIGGTVASVTGLYLYLNAHLPTDVARLGAQVVSGLGFIGAGTIVVTHKQTIKGLTTAAGLWASGIIGLAIGAGFYEGAVIAAILVLFTEFGFTRVGKRVKYMPEFRMILRYKNKNALDQALRRCKDNKIIIKDLQIAGSDTAEGETEYTAVLALRQGADLNQEDLVAAIRDFPDILEAEIVHENAY